MFRDFVAAIKQAGNKQVFHVGVTQNYSRAFAWRNDCDAEVATLLVCQWHRFPCFRLGRFRHLSRRAPLHRIGIAGRAASGVASFRTSTATTAGDITDIEDRTVGAIHRERVSVAICNRARGVDALNSQDVANCP